MNTESKHTPGEFFVDPEHPLSIMAPDDIKGEDEAPYLIANVLGDFLPGSPEEEEANAKEFVRRWNCHDRLVESLNYIESVSPTGNFDDEEYITLTITGKALRDIRVALAKTKGTK